MNIENGILKECKRLEKDITEMRNDEYHGTYEGGDVEIPLTNTKDITVHFSYSNEPRKCKSLMIIVNKASQKGIVFL